MDTTEAEMGKKSKEMGVEGGDVEEEDEENIKRRISCHPLYGLLLETHLECIKVVLGDVEGVKSGEGTNGNRMDNMFNVSTLTQSELDNFMEAYCRTLRKFKNAMEESVNEMISFLNCMHFELEELRRPPYKYAMPSQSSEAETIEATGDYENQESTEFKTL